MLSILPLQKRGYFSRTKRATTNHSPCSTHARWLSSSSNSPRILLLSSELKTIVRLWIVSTQLLLPVFPPSSEFSGLSFYCITYHHAFDRGQICIWGPTIHHSARIFAPLAWFAESRKAGVVMGACYESSINSQVSGSEHGVVGVWIVVVLFCVCGCGGSSRSMRVQPCWSWSWSLGRSEIVEWDGEVGISSSSSEEEEEPKDEKWYIDSNAGGDGKDCGRKPSSTRDDGVIIESRCWIVEIGVCEGESQRLTSKSSLRFENERYKGGKERHVACRLERLGFPCRSTNIGKDCSTGTSHETGFASSSCKTSSSSSM